MFSTSPSKNGDGSPLGSGRDRTSSFGRERTSSFRERTSSMDKDNASASSLAQNSPKNNVGAKQRWGKIREQVGTMSKKDLEQDILSNISNPNTNSVMKLGHMCLENAFERKATNRKKLVHCGVLLMEWSVRQNVQLSNIETKLLAQGHYEYWQLSGCACEDYNLTRSKVLYEESFKHIENLGNHRLLIDFCRVLQHSGEEERAAQIAMEIVKTFEHSPEYANYLFYTGCLYKSLGKHEQASTYLFESIQQGPPRYFSKLEMMFLISRNIEENSKLRGENCDDAYRMVFDHEKLEGHVDEEVDYDGWINNSETWRILGDKCTLHGMYSIARDLYGQGLLRDETSFLKPKMWFSFAKSCYRCGKTSDAQLAIKQALTMDGYNKQLQSTIKNWSQTRNNFEMKINEGLEEILKSLPAELDLQNRAALRIQASFKSYKTKRDIALGIGKKQRDGKKFSSKRMRAFLGTMIEEKYPIVIEVFADFAGCIKNLLIHDINTNKISKLKLRRPFMPNLQMGPPRPMKAFLILKKNDQDQVNQGEQTIIIKFVDRKTGEYLERDVLLKYRIVAEEVQEDNTILIPLPDTKYLSLQLHEEDCIVSSSIVDIEIARNTFHWNDMLFLYRFYQEANTTNIAVTQASTDKRILFTMKREHIDRCQKFVKTIKLMEYLIENHPTLAALVLNVAPSEQDVNHNFSLEYEYKRGHKKTLIMTIVKDPIGVVVNINDSRNIPIIGTSFEIVTDDALSDPNPPSRHKKRLREEASARSLASSQSRERSLTSSIDSIENVSVVQTFDNFNDFKAIEIEDKGDALILGSNLDDDISITSEKAFPMKEDDKKPPSSPSNVVDDKNSKIVAPGTPSTPGTPGTPSTPSTKRKLVIKKASSKAKVVSEAGTIERSESKDEQDTSIKRSESKDLEQIPSTVVEENTQTSLKIENISEETSSVIETTTDSGAVETLSVAEPSSKKVDTSKSRLMSMKQQKVEAKRNRDNDRKALEEAKNSEAITTETTQTTQTQTQTQTAATVEIVDTKDAIVTETETGVSALTEASIDLKTSSDITQRPPSKQSRSRKESPIALKSEIAASTILENPMTAPVDDIVEPLQSDTSIEKEEAKKEAATKKVSTKASSRLEKMKSKKITPSKVVPLDKEQDSKETKSDAKLDDPTAVEIKESKAQAKESIAEAKESKADVKEIKADAKEDIKKTEAKDVGLIRPEPIQLQNPSETAVVPSSSPSPSSAIDNFKTRSSTESRSPKMSPVVMSRKQSVKSMNFMEIQAKRMEAGDYIKERVRKALILAHRCDVSIILADKAKSAKYLYLAAIEAYEMSQSFITQEIEVIVPVSKPEVDHDSKVVLVKKPKIDKPRKVINMHYKPALSSKQKEKLHSQPFKVEDIPTDAFTRAEKLVLALKELSKQKISLNDPKQILPVEVNESVTIISGSLSVNYGMDTNRIAAEDIELRNKIKARDLLAYMLANPASSRNNSAKRSNISSRRSTRTPGGYGNGIDWVDAFIEDPTVPRPLSFNADKVSGYFDDRSSLYTTRVTSPTKVLEIESSLNNPVSFLHNEPAPVYPLYQESLKSYKSKGYINGSPTYAKIWKDKLDAFHVACSDPVILNKLLTTLMKINPDKVSVEEAYCSLADTNGSINEALGKLSSKSYVKEIQVVCTMTPIDQYLPMRILSTPTSPMRSQVRSPSVMSIGNTNTSYDNDDRGSVLMRVHGNDAENKLPHYNMLQSSAAVQKRGATLNTMPKSPISKNDSNHSNQTSPINLPPIVNSNNNVIDLDQSMLDISKSLLTMSVVEVPPPNTSVLKSSSLSLLGDKKPTQRLASAIDQIMHNNPSPIKVMTKRDAMKAHEDEILYKSNNIKFKKLSSLYKDEMKQYKKNNNHLW